MKIVGVNDEVVCRLVLGLGCKPAAIDAEVLDQCRAALHSKEKISMLNNG